MNKISLQMYTLRNHTKTIADLDKTLARLHEIGFEMLQYTVPAQFDPAEVKNLFDRYGITNDSVYSPALRLQEDSVGILAQCELFGTDHVRINSIPKGLTSTPAGYRMFAHYLNEATEDLARHGIRVLYHFHAFEFIRFGDTTGIEILLSESDPDRVQIIPDTHWIHSGGKNVVDFLTKYKDRFDYVHLKDFAIGEREETVEARPIRFAPVGEGNLDWAPILDLCRNLGVKSYAIEQDDCYGRAPFDCVASSFRYLSRMGVDRL